MHYMLYSLFCYFVKSAYRAWIYGDYQDDDANVNVFLE